MKKRSVPSKVSVASTKPSGPIRAIDDSNFVTRSGLFTFPNGDRYEGEYRIYGGQLLLVRQGRGVYDTDDFNRYEAVWDRDRISDDLHIRFNNGTEYKGSLDKDGNMSGPGTYLFPDGSSITAVWNKNKPSSDIRYNEPLGFVWNGELYPDGDEIRFTSGNHFWGDMLVFQDSESKNRTMSESPSKSNLPAIREADLPKD